MNDDKKLTNLCIPSDKRSRFAKSRHVFIYLDITKYFVIVKLQKNGIPVQ